MSATVSPEGKESTLWGGRSGFLELHLCDSLSLKSNLWEPQPPQTHCSASVRLPSLLATSYLSGHLPLEA